MFSFLDTSSSRSGIHVYIFVFMLMFTCFLSFMLRVSQIFISSIWLHDIVAQTDFLLLPLVSGVTWVTSQKAGVFPEDVA